MSTILAADTIGKSYGARRVLTAASLAVSPGRVTALLGRNGCGKSTLLHILAGLIRADHGRVLFLGRHWTVPRLHRMAAHGLFLMPERDLLCRGRSVAEHFELLAARFGGSTGAAVRRAIAQLEIDALLDRPPELLSGGEKRRAELALAVARTPVCLLADEPFMGIAPRDVDVITRVLRELARAGTGILVTGHEVDALLHLADDVVWMTAGTTHRLGAPELAEQNYAFRRDYLGSRRLVFTPRS